MGQRDMAQEPTSDEPDIKKLSPRRRHVFLRGRYRWNRIRCQPPYDDVSIYDVEDLFWIARQRGWTSIAPLTLRARLAHYAQAIWSRLRRDRTYTYGGPPNLRGAHFVDLDLSKLDLSGANLEGATFGDGCILNDTKLVNAKLRGAKLGCVDLSQPILLDPNDARTQTLTDQLPRDPATPPTGQLVRVYTRNELLWVISKDYDPRWLDLSKSDVYERDLADLELGHSNFASASSWALIGPLQQHQQADVASPFSDIVIHSWKDLRWLKLASAAGILSIALSPEDFSDLRDANLSGGDFRGADLSMIDLRGAKLAGAKLDAADLSYSRLNAAVLSEASAQGANLMGAKLIGAELTGIHLEEANLFAANLHLARLDNASLTSASLSTAELRGATFREANLECVDLRGASVNAATSFIDAKVSSGTQWGDVVFHSTPLLEINWRSAKRLGDESILRAYDYTKRSGIRYRYYRDVMRAYRQIYSKLYEQGFYGPARVYRLREKYIVRKQLCENRQWRDLFYSWVAFALIGYGEQPGKLILPYFLIIGAFAALYYALAHHSLGFIPFFPSYKPDQLTWVQSFTLSASSFRGEPSFPQDLLRQHTIGKILPVVGALETAIGTVILLAMTLLWTRRLFGNETPVVEARELRQSRRARREARALGQVKTRDAASPSSVSPPSQDSG